METICAHCEQAKTEFEPLDDGTPSRCCVDCWTDFKARYDRDVNDPLWWEERNQERLRRRGGKRNRVVAIKDYI